MASCEKGLSLLGLMLPVLLLYQRRLPKLATKGAVSELKLCGEEPGMVVAVVSLGPSSALLARLLDKVLFPPRVR